MFYVNFNDCRVDNITVDTEDDARKVIAKFLGVDINEMVVDIEDDSFCSHLEKPHYCCYRSKEELKGVGIVVRKFDSPEYYVVNTIEGE